MELQGFGKEGLARIGYWAFHPYERVSVERDVQGFCGWDLLKRIVEAASCKRDKALVATAFETGGRISEVLMLRKSNFKFQPPWIIVEGMKVLKRYEKLEEWVEWVDLKPKGKLGRLYRFDEKTGKWFRKRWKTQEKFVTRRSFAIPMDEPLAPIMVEWVEASEDWLFPTWKHEKIERGEPWLSRVRAYQIIREIGLKVGVKLYDHWFRAQRACQLASEYGYGLMEILDWFDWKHVETAKRYAKLSWRDLAKLMRPNWFKKKT